MDALTIASNFIAFAECPTNATVVSWAGGTLATAHALFGPSTIQSADHENLALVVAEPADGCGINNAGITNAADLIGKVALIQRGGACSFGEKTLNAQTAGAAAVLIYNNAAGILTGMENSQSRRLQVTSEDDSTCDGVAWPGTMDGDRKDECLVTRGTCAGELPAIAEGTCDAASGEAACENHGYDEQQCNAVSNNAASDACCVFDFSSNECHAQADVCIPIISGDTLVSLHCPGNPLSTDLLIGLFTIL